MKRGRERSVTYPSITPLDKSDGLARDSEDISVCISFPFRHLNHSFTISVSRSLYLAAVRSGKSALVPAGTGDAWLAGYYAAFAEDPRLQPVYTALLTKMRQIRSEQNLTTDEYLEMLAAYVQSLPYDAEKLTAVNRAPRFPVETIVDGRGICSDKSVLLAGLLAHEGYAAAILQFSPENHVTAGIPVPSGYDYAKTGYAVIETTVISYVGDTSGEFAPGRRITSRPKVFPIGHGSRRYGSIAEIRHILTTLDRLTEKIAPDGPLAGEILRQENMITDEKNRLADRRSRIQEAEREMHRLQSSRSDGFLPAYHAYKEEIDSYNLAVSELGDTITRYNTLVDEFNRLAGETNFIRHNRLDRRSVTARIRNLQF